MGQINRFYISAWSFPLFSFWSRNFLAIMRFPVCFSSGHCYFCYAFKSAYPVLLKQARLELETLSFRILKILFHINTGKMNEPIRMALLLCSCCPLFPSGFHVADCDSFCSPRLGSKHGRGVENICTFHFLPIASFSRFFAIHRFPAIFWPSRLTYDSS